MADNRDWIAKAAIAELITRYAALNDAADWEAVAALYVEEGRMSRPIAPDNFIVGRRAILEAFRARPARVTRHIVVNILVTLEGEARASATSQILLFTGKASESGGLPALSSPVPLIGSYRDRLVHAEQGWRFVERRGSLDFSASH